MSLIDKFKNILHDNENVVDVACANKKSFIIKRVLFPAILFVVAIIVLTIVANCIPERRDYLGYYRSGFPLWVLFLVSGVLLIILLIILAILYKASKNYFICLTNERIIIRHGIFTTDYTYYAIDKVSGNITIDCRQSIFDRREDTCALNLKIELLPVGHDHLSIFTPSIVNGYEFSKKIDKQVKDNAKLIQPIKE